MSGKIKSKDLSYDTSLPPFLQRLHAAKGGNGDADRHERAIARPKKAKDENEDDGPTVVDEDGETLTKEEYEKRAKAETDDQTAALVGAASTLDGETAASKSYRKVTDGVAVKKRKIAKVVGDEDEKEPSKDVESTTSKAPKKAKKKSKPVKLAFDDDD